MCLHLLESLISERASQQSEMVIHNILDSELSL